MLGRRDSGGDHLNSRRSPALGATGTGSGGFSLQPTYRANDYAGGQAMYILPAGENGLVNQKQTCSGSSRTAIARRTARTSSRRTRTSSSATRR